MKNKWHVLIFGFFVFAGLLGCGVTDTVLSNVAGGSKGNTVANLWPDVPPIQGAQKLSLDLPITVQLAIQGLMKASASSSDVSLDKFDWIAYTTTQTPQQITAFYTVDRMTAAGWDAKEQPGCSSGSDTTGVGGGFCVFGKGKPGEKESVLFIVLAQDDKTKQTQVFYVRLEGITTATPQAAAPKAAATTVALKPGNIDVCKAIPAAEIAKALGRNVQGNPNPFHYNDANTDSGCQWSAGKDSNQNAYFAYAVIAPVQDYATNKSNPTPVTGLGDEAYTTNGADAQQLWVLVNGKAAVMVAIGDSPNVDGAKRLASLLIAQLPR